MPLQLSSFVLYPGETWVRGRSRTGTSIELRVGMKIRAY